jgi:hypothetical protein
MSCKRRVSITHLGRPITYEMARCPTWRLFSDISETVGDDDSPLACAVFQSCSRSPSAATPSSPSTSRTNTQDLARVASARTGTAAAVWRAQQAGTEQRPTNRLPAESFRHHSRRHLSGLQPAAVGALRTLRQYISLHSASVECRVKVWPGCQRATATAPGSHLSFKALALCVASVPGSKRFLLTLEGQARFLPSAGSV